MCSIRLIFRAFLFFATSCASVSGTDLEFAPTTRRPKAKFPIPEDTRPPGCEAQISDPAGKDFEDMKVSIIIPYRRETWEHIQGTMASLLRYTPEKYITEIMFVSDGNGPDTLFAEELQKLSPLITMLVLPASGVGLITAKTRAVAAAAHESSVLVFLEPHIRVNRQWLQPLLYRIREHPKVLAMPALDAIPPLNFDDYLRAAPGHWRFEWNLNLIYTNPTQSEHNSAEPWLSPATSGGIFAIAKDWWNSLEFFDTGMVGWGGDHVEATMKVWRCGGHIVIVPCSRIGHLFREPSHRPYDVSVDQVVYNYARMANTWFDDHLDLFYKMKPDLQGMDAGNLTKAMELRKRLKCKDMSWYIQNVDREMLWEVDKICIGGCNQDAHPDCCAGPAAHQRSTIDKTITPEEYDAPILSEVLKQHEEL